MYLSESHVHLYDDLHPTNGKKTNKKTRKKDTLIDHLKKPVKPKNDELHTKLTDNNCQVKLRNNGKQSVEKLTRRLSMSEDNIARRLQQTIHKEEESEDEEEKEYPNTTTCDVCRLEYMHTVRLEFPLDNETLPVVAAAPKEKGKRKTHSTLNMNDYSEQAHLMEMFSADNERKWTLCYEATSLSKIIIGRGQRDEDYPECNSIHLVASLHNWKVAPWRNALVDDLKSINEKVTDSFSLLPTSKACLFCLDEQNKGVLEKVKSNLPLVRHTSDSTKYTNENGLPNQTHHTLSTNNALTQSCKVKPVKQKKNTLRRLAKIWKMPILRRSSKKLSIEEEKEDEEDDEEFEIM